MTQPLDPPPPDPFATSESPPMEAPWGLLGPSQRPDLPWLLAYRVLGLRLPERYRPWVAADVRSKFFVWFRSLRTLLWGLVLLGLYCVGQHVGLGKWPSSLTLKRGVLVLLALTLLSSREVLAKRTLRWQRIDADGAPAEPARLGRLSGAEGVLLTVMALLVWVGASTAFGYGLRPTGPIAAPCREPDPALVRTIGGGMSADSRIDTIRAVKYQKNLIVAALVDTPKAKKPKSLGVWVVVDGEKVYRLETAAEQMSSFPIAPQGTLNSQAAADALRRAVECLGKAAAR